MSSRRRLSSLFFIGLLLLPIGGCALFQPPVEFQIIDDRSTLDREGGPSQQYTRHGDKSLSVDRLMILDTRLREHLGERLQGKIVRLRQFYVVEGSFRPSFKRDASGKAVPNDGPFTPTLFAQIDITIEEDHFGGFTELKMAPNSRATASTLQTVTDEVIADMLKEMDQKSVGTRPEGK